jgi:flagellar motor switch/type III secretory pathway protein FliN
MFSQDEIDAVLSQAQEAVDSLAQSAGVTAAPAAAAPPVVAPLQLSSPASDRTNNILKIRVPVVVRLADRPMVLNEIMKLGPGTILEFYRSVDSELDLMVNNRRIGCGVAVKVNEHFGLRLNRLGDLRQRIASLGG